MVKTILITFTIFAAFAQTFGVVQKPQAELNLANTIFASALAIQNDPVRSAQCFAIYMPKLTNLTNAYEAQYQECIQQAENNKEVVRKEVEADASVVNKTSEEICRGLSECALNAEPYDYFECSNAAASAAIPNVYNIQTLSKDRMQYISLRYELISYDQNVCTDKCSQTYVEESAKVHAELQDCLAGKVPEVSSTTETSTTATSTSTTDTSTAAVSSTAGILADTPAE